MTRYIVTHWNPDNYKASRTSVTFYTPYHADQYARALALNKTPFSITIKGKVQK